MWGSSHSLPLNPFLFCSCDEHHSSYSPSEENSEQELNRTHGGMLLTSLLSEANNPTQLAFQGPHTRGGTACAGPAHTSHQSRKFQIPPQSYLQTNLMETFSQLKFIFPDDQACAKLTKKQPSHLPREFPGILIVYTLPKCILSFHSYIKLQADSFVWLVTQSYITSSAICLFSHLMTYYSYVFRSVSIEMLYGSPKMLSFPFDGYLQRSPFKSLPLPECLQIILQCMPPHAYVHRYLYLCLYSGGLESRKEDCSSF